VSDHTHKEGIYQRLRDTGKDVDFMHIDALRREVHKLRAELDAAVQAATELEHANHVQFANDIYATLVDPVESSFDNEADLFTQCLKAATEQRQALQAATERRSCRHLKADLVPADWSDEGIRLSDPYCRTCAENLAAIATAMVQQREADAKLANLRIVVPRIGEGCEIAARQRDYIAKEIHNTPLASAPSQEWLTQHDAEMMAQQREAMREHLEGIVQETIPPHLVNLSISLEVIRNLATEALNAPLADAPAQKWLEQMERHDRELRDKAFQAGTQATRGDIAQLKQEYTQQLAAARRPLIAALRGLIQYCSKSDSPCFCNQWKDIENLQHSGACIDAANALAEALEAEAATGDKHVKGE
jgi:hypothetical protein